MAWRLPSMDPVGRTISIKSNTCARLVGAFAANDFLFWSLLVTPRASCAEWVATIHRGGAGSPPRLGGFEDRHALI
jgi:hypothetical protein